MKRTLYLDAWLTLLADLFFVWVLVHFGMGSLENGLALLVYFGPWSWLVLGLVVFLLLWRSNWRSDLPLFLAGWGLGYWGEWWGTTRGVWAYWNGAMPPDYLPPLWGLGLLTVYRLAGLLGPALDRPLLAWARRLMALSFVALPLLALLLQLPLLRAVDWRGRLDLHFLAGLLAGAALIAYRFDLRRAFALYLCGMLLGGLYETLGTQMGEWAYITGEQPPLWIVPLWGLAAVAMTSLAEILRVCVRKAVGRIAELTG
jgi:hypothetical protein